MKRRHDVEVISVSFRNDRSHIRWKNNRYLINTLLSSNEICKESAKASEIRDIISLQDKYGYRNAIYANRYVSDDYSFQQAFDISNRQILFPITDVSFLYAFITVVVLCLIDLHRYNAHLILKKERRRTNSMGGEGEGIIKSKRSFRFKTRKTKVIYIFCISVFYF